MWPPATRLIWLEGISSAERTSLECMEEDIRIIEDEIVELS